jgi:hypothetical protein
MVVYKTKARSKQSKAVNQLTIYASLSLKNRLAVKNFKCMLDDKLF